MVAAGVSAPRRWPSLAWLVRRWPALSRHERADRQQAECADMIQRAAMVRYYLGRGRRAREAGRFGEGCSHARRAIDANPGNPWSHALLGQCLLRQRRPDLESARRAFERACALDPSNGYFVGLLLQVLDAQGDTAARDDALAWAWWSGAPVERWLPAGPRPHKAARPAAASSSPMRGRERTGIMPSAPARMLEPVVMVEGALV